MGKRRCQGDYNPVDGYFSGSSQLQQLSGMAELVFVALGTIMNVVH